MKPADKELGTVAAGNTAVSCLKEPWKIISLIYSSKLLKIEPLLFLYMFGRFFYIPLFEQYYFVRFGSNLLQNTSFPFPNGTFCLNSSQVDQYYGQRGHKLVETASNNLVLYGQLAARIPGLLTVLIIGPLSDRYGRKMVMISALFGTLLQSIVALFIITFHLSPYYFILSSFLTGIFGDFTGLIAGAFSYIADVSSPKWRTFRIGMIEGMLAIGGAAGQFLSGYWLNLNNCNFLPLMGLEVACCVATLAWTVFLIPESLPKEKRMKRAAGKPKGLQAALQGMRMFLGRVPEYSAWKLWVAIIMFNLPLFNAEGGLLISVYFLKAPPFDVNSSVVGIFQAIQSVSRAICVTFVLFSFSVTLRMSDSASAFVGVSFQLAANTLMGLASTTIQVYSIAVVQGVEAISWAAGRSLLSKLVVGNDQGALFSIIASIQSLMSLLSSVLWPLFYPMTLQTKILPSGFIYLMMAAVDLLAYPFLIALIMSEVLEWRRRARSNHFGDKLKEKEQLLSSSNRFGDKQKEKERLLANGHHPIYQSTGESTGIN